MVGGAYELNSNFLRQKIGGLDLDLGLGWVRSLGTKSIYGKECIKKEPTGSISDMLLLQYKHLPQ